MCKKVLYKSKSLTNLNTINIATFGVAAAVLVLMQMLLSFIPNIEFVTLLIMLYTIYFKFKSLYIIYVFVFLEGIIFGFSLWWISYLYVWLILFTISYFIRNSKSPIIWAIVAAIFGFLFGPLSAIPYFFIGKTSTVIIYICAGIIYDVIHGISNFIIVFIMFKPLNKLFKSPLL